MEEQFGGVDGTTSFADERFCTTAAAQMRDGVGTPSVVFGAGITSAKANQATGNVFAPDTSLHARDWRTVTQTAYIEPKSAAAAAEAAAKADKPGEFASTFKLRGGITDAQALEAYRSQWTTDTSSGALNRFKTTTQHSNDKAVQPRS